MSRFTTYLKARVRRLLIARSQGIDLSQLDRVPDSLAWPLHRVGPDPVPRLGERLAEDREHVAMSGAHLQRAFR